MATLSMLIGLYCLLVAFVVECHSLDNGEQSRDRRFILDDLGGQYKSVEQYTSCGLACVPEYKGGALEVCCLTGEDAICQAIRWDIYRGFVGQCTTPAATTGFQTSTPAATQPPTKPPTPQPTVTMPTPYVATATTSITRTSTLVMTSGCDDDSNCGILQQSLQGTGQDICTIQKLKYFCNRTCSLCPGMSHAPVFAVTTDDPCVSISCQHGRCIDIGSSARCHCDHGYIGQFCNIHDPCSVQPCSHGICVPLALGSFRCVCQSGYIGFLCDTVDPCQPNPCTNGNCSLTGSVATCSCDLGYTGYFCDRTDPCIFNPCLNGKCVTGVSGSVTCQCNTGYSGLLCDVGP